MSSLLVRGNALRLPLADQSVDLVFGSPPYLDSRLYLEDGKDLGIARNCPNWVEWMLQVSREAIRVSRGPVLWVVSGNTRDRNYRPGPEGLVWEWYKSGGFQECPCYWHRVGISGSGGDQWFRKDVEYVVAFKRAPKFEWSDNTAMGHPPKWAPGGEMSHRLSDGTRTNQWGGHENQSDRGQNGVLKKRMVKPSHRMGTKASTVRRDNGDRKDEVYVPPALANPGNLVKTNVGGGLLGHDLAHENEAPFPEDLAEWFIKSLCPPGGLVLDPFSGSGTTASVAARLGRRGIGLDLRQSQCLIGKQRINRPHAPVPRPGKTEYHPLFERGGER